MSDDLKPILAQVADGKSLSSADAETAFDIIMSGNALESQIGAFLMGLRVRGETVDEITGAVKIMRAKALHVSAPDGAIDVVGTGGDGHGTYNISTGAAFVVAGGAADVLTALGVNLDCDMALVEKSMVDAGIGFLMAPRHHSAMKYVVPVRGAMGVRTIFNLLGPLSNPAGVKRQFTGAYDRTWIEPMAEVLGNLGCEAAWVVNGADGLDEMTTTGVTYVAALENGALRTFEVTPEDAGLPRASLDDLKGGDGEANAAAIHALLDGTPGPYRDVVLLNAAASLIVAGKAEDLKTGAAMAATAIDDGKAREALDRLVQITNGGS